MPDTFRVLKDGIVETVHTGRMAIQEATESRSEAAGIMNKRGLGCV